jgi:hypothetical protein
MRAIIGALGCITRLLSKSRHKWYLRRSFDLVTVGNPTSALNEPFIILAARNDTTVVLGRNARTRLATKNQSGRACCRVRACWLSVPIGIALRGLTAAIVEQETTSLSLGWAAFRLAKEGKDYKNGNSSPHHWWSPMLAMDNWHFQLNSNISQARLDCVIHRFLFYICHAEPCLSCIESLLRRSMVPAGLAH